MIDCHQLCKTFHKGRRAIDHLSLTVEEGEFIIITGPPSSGKSTLLSLMAGILKPDSGECTQYNRNKYLGIVFQKLHLIDTMTVFENVILPLQFSRVPHRLAKNRALEALHEVGMLEEKDSYPNKLSQGENQLVAIARALVPDPKILLLDEPTSFLDHQTGVRVFTLFRQLALDQLITVVCVTNDVRLHPFAHRLVKMKSGRIENIVGESLLDEIPPPLMEV